MVVLYDTAVGADRNVDASLLIVLVSLFADVDESGGLAAANALGLTGDADGTAADADLYEVSTAVCEEAEALTVDDVTGADLYGVTVGLTDPGEGAFLPLGEALGGVDAEDVSTCLEQCRNSLLVVSGVDAGAYKVGLVVVEQLIFVLFMGLCPPAGER